MSAENTLTQQVNTVISELAEDIKNQKLQLPSPPAILLQLKKAVTDKNISADKLGEVLRLDPHISARLIKVANSVLFGSRNPVTSIKSAVARLGVNKVQNLITGLIIAQHFLTTKSHGLENQLAQAWQQSFQVAAICHVLAEHKSDIDPEHAMLAGLTHNIGTLPLLLHLNKIDRLKQEPKLMAQVSQQVIDKLSPKVSGLILQNWHFPVDIIRAVVEQKQAAIPNQTDISLNDLLKVAYVLKDAELLNARADLADNFSDHNAFNKLWQDADKASHELRKMESQVVQVLDLISA